MKLQCKRMLSLLLSLLPAASFVWPAASAQDSGYTAGDIIEYGSYPQSLVTDAQLLAVLPRLPGEEKTFEYYGETVGTGAQVGQYLPFEGMRYAYAAGRCWQRAKRSPKIPLPTHGTRAAIRIAGRANAPTAARPIPAFSAAS